MKTEYRTKNEKDIERYTRAKNIERKTRTKEKIHIAMY